MHIAERVPLWSLFLLAFVVCVASWYPGHEWGGDFAAYLEQARVLVDGGIDAYVADARFSVEHSDLSFGPAFYGWGFPLILAPVYAAFGLELMPFKVLMALFLMGTGFLAYRLFRGVLRPSFVRLALVILLLSPTTVEFTNVLYPDVAFMCLFVGTLLLTDRWRSRDMSPGLGAILGFCVFLTTWTRPNGLLLLAPMGILMLSGIAGRDPRAIWRALWPALLCIALLGLGGLALPSDRSDIFSVLRSGLANPWEHLLYYLDEGGGIYQRNLGRILFWVSLPAAVFGAARDWSTRWPLHLVCGLTLLLYLLWPATQGLRFLFPLVPIYCFYLAWGLQALVDRRPAFRWVTLGFSLVVLVHLGVQHVERIPRQAHRVVAGPNTPWAEELWEFVEGTGEEVVFTFRKPRVLHLYTGRRAIWTSSWNEDVSEYLIELLEFRPPSWQIAEPIAESTLVFENEGFRVHRRPDPGQVR